MDRIFKGDGLLEIFSDSVISISVTLGNLLKKKLFFFFYFLKTTLILDRFFKLKKKFLNFNKKKFSKINNSIMVFLSFKNLFRN